MVLLKYGYEFHKLLDSIGDDLFIDHALTKLEQNNLYVPEDKVMDILQMLARKMVDYNLVRASSVEDGIYMMDLDERKTIINIMVYKTYGTGVVNTKWHLKLYKMK